MSPKPLPEYDIAIVGGGVAGCYCAYRLSKARPSARIALFESRAHLGGRLESVSMAGVATPAELGGAFVSDRHAHVCRLSAELGLALAPVAWSRQFSFVRGRRLLDATYVSDPDTIPYRLSQTERGRDPAGLLRGAINAMAPGLPNGAADRYLQRRHFKGRLLDDWAFGALLRQLVSEEAFQCLRVAFGSSANFGDASAYDALRTILDEFTPQQPFVFASGFQSLPTELARRSGADIHLSKPLTQVCAENGRLRLGFGKAAVRAKELIVALPRDALRCVDFRTESAKASAFQALLSKVAPVSACKLFLTFDRPWWRSVQHFAPTIGIVASYTDQPIQQCYYYDDAGPSALLLALFADGATASSWASFFDADGAPTLALVQAALDQLRAMHADAEIPEPIAAAGKMWLAAWHMWNPGARSWRSARALRGPHFGLPIYVCGEAFSTHQGWAEGALESAEALLSEIFLA